MKCKTCGKNFKYGKFATKKEKATGICHDCLNKPFEITSVCRIDLLETFTPKQISLLDDSDMRRLASKMADSYCDGNFWEDLKILTEYILKDSVKKLMLY